MIIVIPLAIAYNNNNASKTFLTELSANLFSIRTKSFISTRGKHNIFSPLQKISEALPNCYIFGVFKSFSEFFIHFNLLTWLLGKLPSPLLRFQIWKRKKVSGGFTLSTVTLRYRLNFVKILFRGIFYLILGYSNFT